MGVDGIQVVDDHSLACWFLEALKFVFEKSPEWAFDVHSTPLDKTYEEINTGICLLGITDSKKSPHGFSSIPLGTQVYRAVGSPKFIAKYFTDGITAETLTRAPILRYNNRDDLQLQWIKNVVGEDLNPATHLLPTSHCFIAASIADMGWCMCPSLVVDRYLTSGELVELIPDKVLSKKLYWHYSRAIAKPSEDLTKSVVEISKRYLQQEPIQTFKLLKKMDPKHLNSNSSHV